MAGPVKPELNQGIMDIPALAGHGVAKGEGRGFSLQEMERLLPRLRTVCAAMAAMPGAVPLMGGERIPIENRFIPISG